MLFSAQHTICVLRVRLRLWRGQGPSWRRTQGQFHHRLPTKTSLMIDLPVAKRKTCGSPISPSRMSLIRNNTALMRNQKEYLRANWISREGLAAVTSPPVTRLNVAYRILELVLLETLKASARNSSFCCSLILKNFVREMSFWRIPSPVRIL